MKSLATNRFVVYLPNVPQLCYGDYDLRLGTEVSDIHVSNGFGQCQQCSRETPQNQQFVHFGRHMDLNINGGRDQSRTGIVQLP